MSRLSLRVSCLTVVFLVSGAAMHPGFGALINDYAGNISVIASSNHVSAPPIKTLDGAGFGGTFPNFTDLNSNGRPEHDTTFGNMWGSVNSTAVSNHWISFDLGAVYYVTNIVIWNGNQAGNLGRGVRDCKIWYSTDASPTPAVIPGSEWTLLGSYTLTQATGFTTYDSVDVIIPNVSARHILVDVENTFENQSGSGNGYAILSALQFYGAAPPPSAPTGLSATTASSSQINLLWTDNSSNEDGFKIERKAGADAYAQIATVGANVTAYEDTGLSGDTEYFYRIRAYNSGGDSAYSNEDSATTDPGPPAAPSALDLTPVSTSQIDLLWTDNAGNETGFEIERKTGAAGYAQIATVGEDMTGYQDSGLATDTEYYYRVRATNAIGNSDWSEASAFTWPNPPAAPSGFSATAISASQINLSWQDNSNNETGFKIERKTGAAGGWSEIATVAAEATSFENTGLAANTEYFYRVRAHNTGGHSGYSNEDSDTTLDDRFYVAKHGLNTNPGTKAAPWATIQHAVTNVTSGRTILIGEGTYTENVLLTNTIHTLTIKGGHNTNDWSWNPADHPTIITGSSGARIHLGGGAISFSGLPSVSNTIMGLTLIGGLHGIVTPFTTAANKSTVTISHCVITNQEAGYGIYGFGPCDFNIYNTVVAKANIGVYHNAGGEGAGITGTNFIFNCTFVTNYRANIWVPSGGKTIIRNTIVHGSYGSGGSLHEGYGIAGGATAANAAEVSHSLVYGNTVNTNGLVTYGDGMITSAAPVFVNYAGGNFRPVKGSPGVDQGVTIPSITDDLDLNPRPWGQPRYDMGAYEIFSPPPHSVFRVR